MTWSKAIVYISAMALVSFLIAFSLWLWASQIQFTVLVSQLEKGCAKPGNHFASIQIQISKDKLWGCTPFGTPAPHYAKKRKGKG